MSADKPLVPPDKHRPLWAGVVSVIALILAGFGAPYLILGLHATSVPTAYAVVQHIPGGQHTYGGVMLLLAIALAEGLIPHGRPMLVNWTARVLGGVAGYAIGIAVAFGFSWATTGTQTWQAITYWGSVALLCGFCLRWKPTGVERVA